MSLSNLRQGSGATDPSAGSFSAPNGPSNVVVNGVLNGTTSTMEFTVSSIDAGTISASVSPDGSTVNLTTTAGRDSVTYLVDDSLNVKASPNGTAVMKISVNGSGGYTYSKSRVGMAMPA